MIERILNSLGSYVSVSILNDIITDTLGGPYKDSLDEALMFKDEQEINDDILISTVKAYTKLAKKYTITEDTVDSFYNEINDLSFNKDRLGKTIEKERVKMAKNMKNIWGSQSKGTMEKKTFAGDPKASESTDKESDMADNKTKEINKIYPKLARELIDEGYQHFIIKTKISETVIQIFLEAGVTFEAPNGTDKDYELVIEEVDEEPATDDSAETAIDDLPESSTQEAESIDEPAIVEQDSITQSDGPVVVMDWEDDTVVIGDTTTDEPEPLFKLDDDTEIDKEDLSDIVDDSVLEEVAQTDSNTKSEEKTKEEQKKVVVEGGLFDGEEVEVQLW